VTGMDVLQTLPARRWKHRADLTKPCRLCFEAVRPSYLSPEVWLQAFSRLPNALD
jgi:hypothetical protein